MDSTTQSFPNYYENTNDTGVGYDVFVAVYVAFSFLIIAPLVIWGQRYQREREAALLTASLFRDVNEPNVENQRQEVHPHARMQQQQLLQEQHHHHPRQVHSGAPFQDRRIQQPIYAPMAMQAIAVRSVFRSIDHVATTAYPDGDPDYISIISGHQSQRINASRAAPDPIQQEDQQQTHMQPYAASFTPSNVPSAATTSRLYSRPSPHPKSKVWDVRARRWKSRPPIGRPEVIRKSFKEETESMGGASNPTQRNSLQRGRLNNSRHIKSHGMSDAASSILTDDLEGPPMLQQQITVYYQKKHRRENSANSSDRSFLFQDVVDDISPNDAADAGDPGRQNAFDRVEPIQLTVCCGPGAMWRARSILAALDFLIELAEPDLEMKRLLQMGIPLTLSASSHSFFHLVIITFIANFISTDAMVAYIIVHLMLGFTNELIGAISDAQSTLCAHSLSTGSWLLAGKYGQIAIVLILLVNIPLLIMWATVMDDLVIWLVDSHDIAAIAQNYTRIILGYQLLQGVSRALTVLITLSGHEIIEARLALGESLVMTIATCLTAVLAEESSLNSVGLVQLALGSACFVVKVALTIHRGWIRLFLKGLVRSCAMQNLHAILMLLSTTVPLLIGAFLEYGEWEILLFFVSSLGSAEVATWAIVGALWRFLETTTEGFGEAAAVRVAYHLGSGNAVMAEHASYKALAVSTAQSLFLTSVLLMAGKNIAKVLTPDPVLQVLLSSLITHLSLGNFVMNFAMNVWSLLGAQGRYRLATLVILLTRWFVTMPMALVCIYGFHLDLTSVMGAVTTGFATSVIALSYVFFRSDWERLSRVMCELNAMMDVGFGSDDSDYDSDMDASSENGPTRSGEGAADQAVEVGAGQ